MFSCTLAHDPTRLDSVKCLAAARGSDRCVYFLEREDERGPLLKLETGAELRDPKAVCLFLSTGEFSRSYDLALHCQVLQWMEFSLSELRPFREELSSSSSSASASLAILEAALDCLERSFKGREFLVVGGGRRRDRFPSLADVFVALDLVPAMMFPLVCGQLARRWKGVRRWHQKVMAMDVLDRIEILRPVRTAVGSFRREIQVN